MYKYISSSGILLRPRSHRQFSSNVKASDMDPRITCPQCQNKLSIAGISRMISCSFSQENFIRITCPQCGSPLSITWISTAIPCSIGQALIRITGDGETSSNGKPFSTNRKAADMDRRIICPYCQNRLPITWISTMFHCSFCQASIRIVRNDYLSKELRISPSITKNQVPVAAHSSGAEQGGGCQKVSRQFCDKFRNTTPGTSSHSHITYASSIIVRPKQRAVLCGVTYSKRRKYKLKGTVADVKNMKELLMRRFQFPEEGIRILTEEGKNNSLFPTKKNIQDSLHWLVHDCQYGDSLVFFFSGHGLRQPEFNGDEIDGFDETICPVDFMEQGVILDNDINDIIVRPLRPGVTLHAIVDACYSGTILDLPFIFDNRHKRWDDNRHLNPKVAYKGTSGGLAISLSTCGDNSMTDDTRAFRQKTMNGAMTNSFTKSINENPNITYGQLLIAIQREITKANDCYCINNLRLARVISKKSSQETLMSSSMEFDVDRTKFNFYPVIGRSYSWG